MYRKQLEIHKQILTCARDELQKIKRKVDTEIFYKGAVFVLYKGTKLSHVLYEIPMQTDQIQITHIDMTD